MNYLYDKILNSSSWSFQNTNNIYNFVISVLNNSDDEQKKKVIEDLKIHCGITFFNGFREYCIRKLGVKNKLINFLE